MNVNSPIQETVHQAKSMMERQTAKLPVDSFMWAAGASIIGSLAMKLIGRDKDALFIGEWAPTFLLLGIMGKLTKNLGSD